MLKRGSYDKSQLKRASRIKSAAGVPIVGKLSESGALQMRAASNITTVYQADTERGMALIGVMALRISCMTAETWSAAIGFNSFQRGLIDI